MKLISNYKYIILSILILSSCGESKTIGKTIDISEGIESTYYDGDYVIDKNIDLKGKSMELPDCGRVIITGRGHVSNGTLIISPNTYEIEGGWGIFSNVKLQSKTPLSNTNKCALPEINARWFCKSVDENIDNTKSLQEAIDAAHNLAIATYIPRGYYLFSSNLTIYEGDYIRGEFTGSITSNNQKRATYLRYIGNKENLISVEGNYVTLRDLMIVANKPYLYDGIVLDHKSSSHFNMNNVFIGNVRYGVSCVLDKGVGFTECTWEKVRISDCVRGLSIDMTSETGQYLTYNNFYNISIFNAQEKGVFLHSRSINTCTFRDCLFENVGYAKSFDPKYIKSEICGIEVINEGPQGSIIIDGGYYENVYYSDHGESVNNFNYSNNAVFSVKNIQISISNVRFANTKSIIKSKGLDAVYINSCIDNGYLGEEDNDAVICNSNPQTLLSISGYIFSNKNKKTESFSNGKKVSSAVINNIRLKNGSLLDHNK